MEASTEALQSTNKIHFNDTDMDPHDLEAMLNTDIMRAAVITHESNDTTWISKHGDEDFAESQKLASGTIHVFFSYLWVNLSKFISTDVVKCTYHDNVKTRFKPTKTGWIFYLNDTESCEIELAPGVIDV